MSFQKRNIKSADELKIERQGTTLKLTLTRPSRVNALSESLVETLLAVLDEAEPEEIRLAVFTGRASISVLASISENWRPERNFRQRDEGRVRIKESAFTESAIWKA